MKKIIKINLLIVASLFISTSMNAQNTQPRSDIRTLIVFFDGLRPDYITPEIMPNLFAFSKKGTYGKQHHSVFPTVTRVNAASYSTGSYPGTHGLLGNTVYFPQVNKVAGLNTGDASELEKITKATNDHLLTAASLGDILQQNGFRMMVFSSGSTGQAYMQNHRLSGGAIINPSMILPETLKPQVLKEIGEVPAGLSKHKWLADAVIKYGVSPDGPLVSAVWFGDPDRAAHSNGIGSPQANESIKFVDEQFGRILQDIERKGFSDKFNIIISTDHGFVTQMGTQPGLADFLIQKGLKKSKESDDVVISEGAIYVKDHNKELIAKIVDALQQEEWVGGVFTKGAAKGDTQGSVKGTLSFDAIHWDHPDRSSDILIDLNWNDEKNEAGYAGKSYARGVAGHGGFSSYEVHIALLASGPGFKKSTETQLPTSNIDIVPTILHLHNIAVPSAMDGRIMYEILSEKTPSGTPQKAKTEIIKTVSNMPWGEYQLSLERTVLGKYTYTNFTRVNRKRK